MFCNTHSLISVQIMHLPSSFRQRVDFHIITNINSFLNIKDLCDWDDIFLTVSIILYLFKTHKAYEAGSAYIIRLNTNIANLTLLIVRTRK